MEEKDYLPELQSQVSHVLVHARGKYVFKVTSYFPKMWEDKKKNRSTPSHFIVESNSLNAKRSYRDFPLDFINLV